MFGRRRRVAPVVQPAAPELSDEQILETIHTTLADLIGVDGSWTLTPRTIDDTDVIFHGLKTAQIAEIIAAGLRVQKAVLRGEVTGEPAALPWTPAPISVWADPIERATAMAAVTIADEADAADAPADTSLDADMVDAQLQERLVA
jgi:proline racemase